MTKIIKLPWGGLAAINGEETTISGTCVITGAAHLVKVPSYQFVSFEFGAFIQDAFPELSSEQREFIKSGISPKGWVEMFGEDDDADE